MAAYSRTIRWHADQQRIDFAQEHRVGVAEDDQVGCAGISCQAPIGGTMIAEFGENGAGNGLPVHTARTPGVRRPHRVEVAILPHANRQASQAIRRSEAAQREIEHSDLGEEAGSRRDGDSKVQTHVPDVPHQRTLDGVPALNALEVLMQISRGVP